jgi:hypothetical protein
MQYKAANIGSGMDAKIAPNFPRIEKKIMNPADIWTTLRLPTCVKASKPAFSLQISKWIIRERQLLQAISAGCTR